VSPTRRVGALVALVAVIAVALEGAWGIAAALAAGILGLTIADALTLRSRRVEVTRTQVPTLARGAEFRFEVRASPVGSGSSRLRQPVPPELTLVPAEAPGDIDGVLVGRHRGVHTLPRTVVRMKGPLGLASSDRYCGEPSEVVVMPDLPRARRMAESRARGRLAEAGRNRSRLGIGTEFESIRDYSPDDDVRQINWTATARVGRPMSNQYRIDENRDLMCLIDTGRLMSAPIGSATRMDIALDALAVLAVAAEQADDRVGVLAFGTSVLRYLAPRRRGAEAVVRAVFDLEPSEIESDYELAFAAVGGAKRALVTLFTDLMDEAATSSLLDALPTLTSRHAVMAVTCVDADLVEAANEPPSVLIDALRQAAAVDLLDRTARSVDLMRHMGAVVVQASPADLGAASVEGYLRLKRRARL
jgi:uncharacterized protein (DUF58 family)